MRFSSTSPNFYTIVNAHVHLVLSIAVCRTYHVDYHIVHHNIATFPTGYASPDECFDKCLTFADCNSIEYNTDDGRCYLSADTSRTQPLTAIADSMYIQRCVSI